MEARPPMIVQLFRQGDMEKFNTLLSELPVDICKDLISEACNFSYRFVELYNDETNMRELAASIKPYYHLISGDPRKLRKDMYFLGVDSHYREFAYVTDTPNQEELTVPLHWYSFDTFQDLVTINWEEVEIQLTQPINIK